MACGRYTKNDIQTLLSLSMTCLLFQSLLLLHTLKTLTLLPLSLHRAIPFLSISSHRTPSSQTKLSWTPNPVPFYTLSLTSTILGFFEKYVTTGSDLVSVCCDMERVDEALCCHLEYCQFFLVWSLSSNFPSLFWLSESRFAPEEASSLRIFFYLHKGIQII